jgi:hypothetical protein
MDDSSEIVKVYTGTEITIALLKSELEKAGIVPLLKDDFASGVASGFFGGAPSAIDLYVQESDLKRAEPILRAFMEINEPE